MSNALERIKSEMKRYHIRNFENVLVSGADVALALAVIDEVEEALSVLMANPECSSHSEVRSLSKALSALNKPTSEQ